MSGMELQMFLKNFDGLFESLEQETLACLNNLESMPVQEIERFVEKRQKILSAIQKFDTDFNNQRDNFERSEEVGFLEKFRQRQTVLLKRVIKADGLLLALAEMGLTSLKSKQADISRGRCALHGYREETGTLSTSLQRIV